MIGQELHYIELEGARALRDGLKGGLKMMTTTLVLSHEIGPGSDREVQIFLADRWRKLVLIQLRHGASIDDELREVNLMKRSLTVTATVVSILLFSAVMALAQPAPSGSEQSHHTETSSQGMGTEMMGGKGADSGMMGAQGMMGGSKEGEPGKTNCQGMMGGPGMMDMKMMQRMMSDPKTRGQMMEIHGRMMKEVGDLMVKRGQEVEKGK
jgi:hypothetical protein